MKTYLLIINIIFLNIVSVYCQNINLDKNSKKIITDIANIKHKEGVLKWSKSVISISIFKSKNIDEDIYDITVNTLESISKNFDPKLLKLKLFTDNNLKSDIHLHLGSLSELKKIANQKRKLRIKYKKQPYFIYNEIAEKKNNKEFIDYEKPINNNKFDIFNARSAYELNFIKNKRNVNNRVLKSTILLNSNFVDSQEFVKNLKISIYQALGFNINENNFDTISKETLNWSYKHLLPGDTKEIFKLKSK